MPTRTLPVIACHVLDESGDKTIIALATVSEAQLSGLSPRQIVGQLIQPSTADVIESTNFARNPAFVEFMHDVIRRHGPRLPGLQAAARSQLEGHVFIIDGRTASPEGPVPPEDIVGGFQVHKGLLDESSYSANPNHRLLSDRGLARLDSHLVELLQAEASQPPFQPARPTPVVSEKPWYKFW